MHASWLSLEMVAIAVSRCRRSSSPRVYGNAGWIGGVLAEPGPDRLLDVGHGLATIFVSLPFVAREVVPVLARSASSPSRSADARLGRRADLPAHTVLVIRWAPRDGDTLCRALLQAFDVTGACVRRPRPSR